VNGVPVRDTAQLKLGDSVTTIVDGGRFESEVKTIQSS
jgi:predicted lysophospholipase L1 biosynthesis ABC-type transport system permease subunit